MEPRSDNLCEGYATGEAIAESIQYSIPVIVVYVAGNIMNVVRDFRAEFLLFTLLYLQ
jgi:phage/plasmid primase-like uncharacterized protein